MPSPAKLSETEFQALIKRQGLDHTPDELAEFYHAYEYVAQLTALIRQPRGHMAEAALTFNPLQGAAS